MAFKLPYECEFCGHTIICRKKELPETCPKCEDTGDARPNIEKYNCTTCQHYEGQQKCNLEIFWDIKDIHCPLTLSNS